MTAPNDPVPERRAYPSDLTDAQWRIIEPLLPPAKAGGRPRTANLQEWSTPYSTSAVAAVAGECCPMSFLHGVRFTTMRAVGAGTALGSG